MISAKKLQNQYNSLYIQIRKYLWPFETVQLLADLEEAIYKKFPDLNQISSILDKLRLRITSEFEDDEELKSEFDRLHDLVQSDDTVFSKLDQVNEVISQ